MAFLHCSLRAFSSRVSFLSNGHILFIANGALAITLYQAEAGLSNFDRRQSATLVTVKKLCCQLAHPVNHAPAMCQSFRNPSAAQGQNRTGSILDCGGKRSVTPLSHARRFNFNPTIPALPKAVSRLPPCHRTPKRRSFSRITPALLLWLPGSPRPRR